MRDKPVSVLIIDIVVAAVAIFGLFVALKIFRLPNCTRVEMQPLLMWVTPFAIVLVMGCACELVVGARQGSAPSRVIAVLCALAAVVLVLAYRWKLAAMSMAC